MSAIHQVLLAGGGATYQIANSLRFRAANSAYLTRTPAVAGNRKTATLSVWVKRGGLSAAMDALGIGAGNTEAIRFNAGNTLMVRVGNLDSTTNALFRDPSAWGHLLVARDTTQATSTDRLKVWWNNVALTFSSYSVPAQNSDTDLCNTVVHDIGRAGGGGNYFDGHLANFYLIDGQALTPSSFGQTDATTGVWVPKAYTGTFGTTGFFLEFKDAASTTTIGYDTSGNSNNFTTSGISVTSGVTFDQMTDTPTKNYCVLNPLAPSAANISWANLRSGTTAVRGSVNALLANSYWEVTAGGSAVTAGTISDAAVTNTTTVTANKVFGFRLTSAGTLDYINITDAGAWTNITSGLSGQQFPYGITAAADWNFGQRAFVGTVPSSYYALSTASPISAAVTLSGSFTGNAAADGPFVWTNGNPATLVINGNAVTFGTHADKTAGGFKLRTSSASYNASGSNSWTATAGKRFVQLQKPNNAQVNP